MARQGNRCSTGRVDTSREASSRARRRKALARSAVLDGLADRDRTTRALRVADGEVEGPSWRSPLADSLSFVIARLWAGRHGVAVTVFAEEVDDHRLRDDDLVAVAVEGMTRLDRDLAVGRPGPDAEAADDPPAVEHAVVPAELLAEVELLLCQVGLAEQLPGEVAGALDRHDGATYYPQGTRASSFTSGTVVTDVRDQRDTVQPMSAFALQFPLQQVPEYAARYTDDDGEVLAIGRAVRDRGHYTLEEFRRVCRWKTPRSAPLVAQNSSDSVEASTRVALGETASDRERVKALQSLRGVGVPTASVLLHLVYPERYPILDVRALHALGVRCALHTATGSGSPT